MARGEWETNPAYPFKDWYESSANPLGQANEIVEKFFAEGWPMIAAVLQSAVGAVKVNSRQVSLYYPYTPPKSPGFYEEEYAKGVVTKYGEPPTGLGDTNIDIGKIAVTNVKKGVMTAVSKSVATQLVRDTGMSVKGAAGMGVFLTKMGMAAASGDLDSEKVTNLAKEVGSTVPIVQVGMLAHNVISNHENIIGNEQAMWQTGFQTANVSAAAFAIPIVGIIATLGLLAKGFIDLQNAKEKIEATQGRIEDLQKMLQSVTVIAVQEAQQLAATLGSRGITVVHEPTKEFKNELLGHYKKLVCTQRMRFPVGVAEYKAAEKKVEADKQAITGYCDRKFPGEKGLNVVRGINSVLGVPATLNYQPARVILFQLFTIDRRALSNSVKGALPLSVPYAPTSPPGLSGYMGALGETHYIVSWMEPGQGAFARTVKRTQEMSAETYSKFKSSGYEILSAKKVEAVVATARPTVQTAIKKAYGPAPVVSQRQTYDGVMAKVKPLIGSTAYNELRSLGDTYIADYRAMMAQRISIAEKVEHIPGLELSGRPWAHEVLNDRNKEAIYQAGIDLSKSVGSGAQLLGTTWETIYHTARIWDGEALAKFNEWICGLFGRGDYARFFLQLARDMRKMRSAIEALPKGTVLLNPESEIAALAAAIMKAVPDMPYATASNIASKIILELGQALSPEHRQIVAKQVAGQYAAAQKKAQEQALQQVKNKKISGGILAAAAGGLLLLLGGGG